MRAENDATFKVNATTANIEFRENVRCFVHCAVYKINADLKIQRCSKQQTFQLNIRDYCLCRIRKKIVSEKFCVRQHCDWQEMVYATLEQSLIKMSN